MVSPRTQHAFQNAALILSLTGCGIYVPSSWDLRDVMLYALLVGLFKRAGQTVTQAVVTRSAPCLSAWWHYPTMVLRVVRGVAAHATLFCVPLGFIWATAYAPGCPFSPPTISSLHSAGCMCGSILLINRVDAHACNILYAVVAVWRTAAFWRLCAA